MILNLAVALRGMSDRWTHGLPPMADDDRVMAMVFAMTIALGSFYTLITTPAPKLDNDHLVARRLEERTARQSALGGGHVRRPDRATRRGPPRERRSR